MLTFAALLIATLALLQPAASPSASPHTSALWGTDGEGFDPRGRLPDFSHAGYRRGEPLPPPDAPAHRTLSVRDFGAVGDGITDDSAAFLKALAQVDGTTPTLLLIPPGRYLLTDILDLRKSHLTVRGAGPQLTTLVLPKPLNEIRPNMGATTTGQATSNYSWSGGFLWVRGDFRSRPLTDITTPAARGDTTLTVADPARLAVGQEVEVRVTDTPDNSLAAHLYADDPGDTKLLNGRTRTFLTARITAIDGPQVTLDRPLRVDVRPEWSPRILAFEPTVREVGIEGLRFEFPEQPYAGHFTELGHNAIAVQGAADCWVRDIVIDNADSGLFLSGRFCTVENVTFRSNRQPDRNGDTGHHGISATGDDNLITRFSIRQRFIHDLTVSQGAGNVFSRGDGTDLSFDHHKRAPYANLFSELDAGEGSRLWRSGGGASLGKHAGKHTTFWNIRTRRPQTWPPANFAPAAINLIAVGPPISALPPPTPSPAGRWHEPLDPARIFPQDLHTAQRQRLTHPERPHP